MYIKLKNSWFAPGELVDKDGRSMSGQRMLPGFHTVPNSWKDYLPSSVEIIEDGGSETKGYVPPNTDPLPPDITDHDIERAAAAEEAIIHKNAELELQAQNEEKEQRKADHLAKMRDAAKAARIAKKQAKAEADLMAD